MFDRNSDGYIDGEELKITMQFLGEHLTDTDIREMIQEADQDGDGLINFKEFCFLMKLKKNRQQTKDGDLHTSEAPASEQTANKNLAGINAQSLMNNAAKDTAGPTVQNSCHCTCTCSACANCSFKLDTNAGKEITISVATQQGPPKITQNTSTTSTNSSSSGYSSGSAAVEQSKSTGECSSPLIGMGDGRRSFAKLTPQNLGIHLAPKSSQSNAGSVTPSPATSPPQFARSSSHNTQKSNKTCPSKSPGLLRKIFPT